MLLPCPQCASYWSLTPVQYCPACGWDCCAPLDDPTEFQREKLRKHFPFLTGTDIQVSSRFNSFSLTQQRPAVNAVILRLLSQGTLVGTTAIAPDGGIVPHAAAVMGTVVTGHGTISGRPEPDLRRGVGAYDISCAERIHYFPIGTEWPQGGRARSGS
jgi:hypothetical protein